jgi:hypothetical protein
MKILASRIAKKLKKAKHCGIYEPELSRVWPPNGSLRYYKEGFCAIFDKEPVAN